MKTKIISMVLLTSLCIGIMIVSAIPMSRSTTGVYDPILDTNHDGLIDMQDVGGVASSFLAEGDPTVPVNVTNWPQTWSFQNYTVYFESTWPYIYVPYVGAPLIDTRGFARMIIILGVPKLTGALPNDDMRISLEQVHWCSSPVDFDAGWVSDENMENYYNATFRYNVWENWWFILGANAMPIETKGPYMYLQLYANTTMPAPSSAVISVYIYLRNE